MTIKTLVIFANSVKHKKHCVAGKDENTKQWIRPVSNLDGAELTREHTLTSNPYGAFPVKPMQKVMIDFCDHAPLINQPENWLINQEYQWKQSFKINESQIKDFLDTPNTLWGLSNKVDFNNIVNKIINIEQSLYLVSVSNLRLYRNQYNKRKADFEYNSNTYINFSVTDPNFDDLLRNSENGEACFNSAYLCVSLGEKFSEDNHCYKIVAWIYVG